MTGKIAVSVRDPGGLEALLDPRFGRAAGFVVVDAESGEIVTELPNPLVGAAHGAGTVPRP